MISLQSVLPKATLREREVCGLLVRGLTDKQIAKEFGISPKTVNQHRCRLLKLAKVNTATGLIYKVLGSLEVVA